MVRSLLSSLAFCGGSKVGAVHRRTWMINDGEIVKTNIKLCELIWLPCVGDNSTRNNRRLNGLCCDWIVNFPCSFYLFIRLQICHDHECFAYNNCINQFGRLYHTHAHTTQLRPPTTIVVDVIVPTQAEREACHTRKQFIAFLLRELDVPNRFCVEILAIGSRNDTQRTCIAQQQHCRANGCESDSHSPPKWKDWPNWNGIESEILGTHQNSLTAKTSDGRQNASVRACGVRVDAVEIHLFVWSRLQATHIGCRCWCLFVYFSRFVVSMVRVIAMIWQIALSLRRKIDGFFYFHFLRAYKPYLPIVTGMEGRVNRVHTMVMMMMMPSAPFSAATEQRATKKTLRFIQCVPWIDNRIYGSCIFGSSPTDAECMHTESRNSIFAFLVCDA